MPAGVSPSTGVAAGRILDGPTCPALVVAARRAMAQESSTDVRSGQLIADRYRLESMIGRGAMGEVWAAEHVHLRSAVAIKFLNPAIAEHPEMLDRFMREAQSAAAVRSTHVVQIFDYGVESGRPYIAMERLIGVPLDERLAARGPLSPAELDKVFTEVARAVENAHAMGVVHRDLKPANIFIAREGGHEVTKVLDFGIAKLVADKFAVPSGGNTHTGIMLGTPSYMSPEQARGRKVDHRADIWALAVVAFECISGRHPFESDVLGDLMVKICTAEPQLPSALAAVPKGFDAWCLRGLEKDPERRFASVAEMAEALHAILFAEWVTVASAPGSKAMDVGVAAHDARSSGKSGSGSGRGQAASGSPAPAATERTPSVTSGTTDGASVRVPATTSGSGLELRPWLAAGIVVLTLLGAWFLMRAERPDPASTQAPTAEAASRPAAPVAGEAITAADPPRQPSENPPPVAERTPGAAAQSEVSAAAPPPSEPKPAKSTVPDGAATKSRKAKPAKKRASPLPPTPSTKPQADPFADRL